MNIFRQLRWKLTLSYTLVTVSAFLVVVMVMGGIFFTRIFLPRNYFSPPDLIKILQSNSTPLWSNVLSQSPVDTELIKLVLKEAEGTITSFDFLRIGSVEFSVRTRAAIRGLIIGADGTLFGKFDDYFLPNAKIGEPFDPSLFTGLEAPLTAALAGETDPDRLYTTLESGDRFLVAVPILKSGEKNQMQVLGAAVILFEPIPTRGLIPSHLLNLAVRSLTFLLIGVVLVGALFGFFTASRLATRFKKISTSTDAWSAGDFSRFIEDNQGDEISQFAGQLNEMAKQLQSLLRRRQEMAVSEERNRLARDLHDSAKQQALAASFQLGAALTLCDRDPQGAKQHLVEADTLVDSVREELTNLVHELRDQSVDGQDFSEVLKEYSSEWSQHNGIEIDLDIQGDGELAIETRGTLLRIVQEALANVARHSAASHAYLRLELGPGALTLTIQDNGRGFDPSAAQGGVGLASMRERTEGAGGSFTIESAPDQGAKIVVTLPIAG